MGAAGRNGQRTFGLGSLTRPKKAIFNEPYYERMGRREAAQGNSRAAYEGAAAERRSGRMHIARWRLRRSQGLRWRSRWRGRYIIGARLPPQPTTPTQHGALHHLAHTACHHLPVSGPPQGGPRYLPLGLGLGLGLGLSSCHPSVAAVRVRVRVRVRGGGMGGTCDAKAHAAMLHGAKK